MRRESEAGGAVERDNAQYRVARIKAGYGRAGASRIVERFRAVHHALGNAGAAGGEADECGIGVARITRPCACPGSNFGQGVVGAADLGSMTEQGFEHGKIARA